MTASAPARRTGEPREGLLNDLLDQTSRTFALAVPLLPLPTRNTVTLAYLLFRVADTFEDATVLWQRRQRTSALDAFAQLLRDPSIERARALAEEWSAQPPTEHQGYLRLLSRTPDLVDELLALEPASREILTMHSRRTAQGMAGFVRNGRESGLQLRDISEMRQYCYVVAGIVGELLTDVFVHDWPQLEGARSALEQRAPLFGEGLQLVNILKDSSSDEDEGRRFVPQDAERATIFALAREDLVRAAEYCNILRQRGAPDGVIAFCALPVALARATLDLVQESGPGSKLTRPEVFALHQQIQNDIQAGRPVLHQPA